MPRFLGLIILLLVIISCNNQKLKEEAGSVDAASLIILGTLQDGGSPHIGCKKACCKKLFEKPDPTRKVVSLGLIDFENKQTWLMEATPDITSQLKDLKKVAKFQETETPNGIFITHAHIGHYAGLMYLGKEALGAKNLPIYAMPRMKSYLETNGPWSQLVSQNNIFLSRLKKDSSVILSSNFSITPFTVPHRDEYSETVGYKIKGPNKTALFIPDINKWSIWEKRIIDEIAMVDYAFIDATFYDGNEINTRKISEIPHPFVIESMELFHFNHTNPLLNPQSKQSKNVIKQGFKIARFGQVINL